MAGEKRELTQHELLAAFQELAESLALTPDKLKMLAQELNKPYVDPEAEARELREREKIRRDLKAAAENLRLDQEQCNHKYKTGESRIKLIHNFPDGLPRGKCSWCRIYIEPEHWEFAYDPRNPEGRPYKIPAHPLWLSLVWELETTPA